MKSLQLGPSDVYLCTVSGRCFLSAISDYVIRTASFEHQPRQKRRFASGATTLECDVRFACFADEIPHCGCQFGLGGPLVDDLDVGQRSLQDGFAAARNVCAGQVDAFERRQGLERRQTLIGNLCASERQFGHGAN